MAMKAVIGNTSANIFPEYVNCILYIYNFGMIFIAITGNSVVVYASRKFKAINFDSPSVFLIESLAITDILLVLIGYIPKLLTLHSGHWILGELVCYLTAYGQFAPGTSEILLLTTIAAFRCHYISKPISDTQGLLKARITVCTIWIVSIGTSLVLMFLKGAIAYFEPRILSCVTNISVIHKMISIILFLLFAMLPFTLTIILNMYCLFYACRYKCLRTTTNYRGNMNAILTVNAVCVLFITSWIPYIVRVFLTVSGVVLPPWFFILQYNLNIISLALNPVIYSVINRKFRRFILKRMIIMRLRVNNYCGNIFKNSTCKCTAK